MEDTEIESMKKSALVLDIETSASYPDGTPVPIKNFEDYVKYAKAKFFGAYSYIYDSYIVDIVDGNEERIRELINEHDILIGFNHSEFDLPILRNNGLMHPDKRFNEVDLLVILGASNYARHDGLPFKNRGLLMGYKYRNNSLRVMAETMGLSVQKGNIDYNIFFQKRFTPEEYSLINEYLQADVKVTRELFEVCWKFWKPFTAFISDDNIKNLSWLKSSIASLTYKSACNVLGVEETYADNPGRIKEEMGGRVMEPKYEEACNVWYVDFASLYPHMFTMFNLFDEIDTDCSLKEAASHLDKNIWHGNDVFKVKGFYDISGWHPLSKDIAEKLDTRIKLKSEDADHPMVYTLKILLNSLYGACRSPVFEKIHRPNAGWDCCWLGQQINELTERMMDEFGFEVIYGDTDSLMMISRPGVRNDREYVQECLAKVVDYIKKYAPFPVDTFSIGIEGYLDYVMWPFSEQPVVMPDGTNLKNEKGRLVKERKGKKKNYLYIYEKKGERKIKMMGLPIIKDNATPLAKKILEETLKPQILENVCAKFHPSYIDNLIEVALSDKNNLNLLAVEYKVKPAATYKNASQIQAQISEGYFDGNSGVISLIKNRKVGKAGKGMKYCTTEEAIVLKVKDFDIDKLKNELEPFVQKR